MLTHCISRAATARLPRYTAALFALVLTTSATMGLASSASASENLVLNPSFEESPFPLHWTEGGFGVDQIYEPTWQVENGTSAVDLNQAAKGTIAQTITTVAGQTYELSYWMAANGYREHYCPEPKPPYTMTVRWGGGIVAEDQFDPNGTFNGEPLSERNMGWQKHSVLVTGTGSDALLFESTNPEGPCGPTLDNVSVAVSGPPPPPPPALTGMTPSKGVAKGGTTVKITGTNLGGVTSVKFGSVSAASFKVNGSTSITAVSPPEVSKTVDVTMSTPTATSAISSLDHFKIGPPVVSGMSSKSGSKEGGSTITVTGSGFGLGTEATLFKFGTTEATTVSCTTITTCTVVVPSQAKGGTVDMKVTVSGQSSAKTGLISSYTYN